MKPLTKNILFGEIEMMRKAVTVESYPVTGFQFILDNPESLTFNPHCVESATVAGFDHKQGMPSVEGFFYISDEYNAYLQALTETNTEHPANTEQLKWIGDL